MSYPRFHPRSELSPLAAMTASAFAREFPGESGFVEFKQGISRRALAEAVVGFSNADGGVVFVGVTKTGRAVGLSQPGERERELHDAVAGVENPGRFAVRPLEVGGATLLVLSIERRREGFAQTSDGVIRRRTGARNEPLKGAELSRFVQRRAFDSFETTLTGRTWSEVPEPVRERIASLFGIESAQLERRLVDEDLLVRVDGELRLTVAGALTMLDDNAKSLGRPGIEILRYAAGEREPNLRQHVVGTADDVVRRTEAIVRHELGRQPVMVGTRRVEIDRLPALALRESIANAVAHRSYEASGTWTRLEIRSEGIVLRSPGALPYPVSLKTLRSQQSARNPKVLDVLHRAGLAEDQGLGIDRIEDEMAAELLEAPTFDEGPDWFEVSLRFSGSFTPEERAWVVELRRTRTLGRDEARLVVLAGREKTVTNASARTWLGVDSQTTRAALRRLRDAGVLRQHGVKGGTSYTLTPNLGLPTTERLGRGDQERVILEMAAFGALTNVQVRERLGIERNRAVTLLNGLVARSLLVREGERRGTRYRLPG